MKSERELLVNPFGALKPLLILIPSNFVKKRVSSCKGVNVSYTVHRADRSHSRSSYV